MKRLSLALCLALGATPGAVAAQDAEAGSAGPVDRREGTHLLSAEDIGVVSTGGDRIGEVEEILIDSQGRPAGFLIDLDGVGLFEDDDVAVPMEALTYDGRSFVSKMTAEQLANLRPWDE